MAFQVTSGSMLICDKGTAPGALTVLPVNRTVVGGTPAATILDSVPGVNIPTFGMCTSMSNPVVIAMGGAAPCTPATGTPWMPGAAGVVIGAPLALTSLGQCLCSLGGTIRVLLPAHLQVLEP